MAKHSSKDYLLNKGFTETRYSFDKGDFILMKTTLGIQFEVVYKGEIIKKIFANNEAVESVYEELTNKILL